MSFATLKTEFYNRRVWPTRAVGAWIEDRCNRRHLGCELAEQ